MLLDSRKFLLTVAACSLNSLLQLVTSQYESINEGGICFKCFIYNRVLVTVISTLIGDLIELVIFRQLIIAQGLGRLLVD